MVARLSSDAPLSGVAAAALGDRPDLKAFRDNVEEQESRQGVGEDRWNEDIVYRKIKQRREKSMLRGEEQKGNPTSPLEAEDLPQHTRRARLPGHASIELT